MNITELIADLQLHFPASDPRDVAKALLAQQVCIEQMREALDANHSLWRSYPVIRAVVQNNKEKADKANELAIQALVSTPDLSALREHGVGVLTTFFAHFAEGKYLEIEADEFQRYIERIMKGE